MSSPVSSSFTGNINGIQFDRQDFFGKDGSDSVQSGTFNGQRVAIKRIELTKGTDQSFGNEFETLQQLEHPNVVRLLQCGNDNNFRYYAFEWCGASLDQLFLKADDTRKYNGPMPHHIDISLQLASGLEYIHSRNLVHGNIKPENVLISAGSTGQDEITLKWANSGLTRYASKRAKITSQVGGNNAWLAPELLLLKLGGNLHGNKYQGTVKSDIFAQGLIFGSLFLNGEHLYGTMENEDEITKNITNGNPINMQKMNRILKDCYEDEIFKRILENDPNKRMTSTAVVNQLKTIKDKISGKEKELLRLCARDSPLDLSEKIKNFIPFGININVKDNDGSNALHLLCRYYSSYELIAAINLVIQSGIDVNARDYNGLNALHYVCRYNATPNLIDAIQNLIKLGIDPKAKSNDGSNALHFLTRYNSSSDFKNALEILIESGINVLEKDNDGWHMFYYLEIKNKEEMKIWYDRKAPLGKGGYGQVFKGKYGGREVAVKRVQLDLDNEKEEKALRALDHPNVVKLLHCDSNDDFRMYVLELCDASLDQLFLEPNHPKKYDGPMPRYIHVFLQLASGLNHIHSKLIIHRDIKPQNVLISKTPASRSNEVTIKWADFGLSKSVDERGYHSWSGVRGTTNWYAPEVLEINNNIKEAEEAKKLKGTVKSDVFALGLVFGFLFLKGEHVYGSSEREISDNVIKKQPINLKKIDGELLEIYQNNLLQKMLENDPSKRMTSEEVVEQLKSIEEKLAEKEKQLRDLCAGREPLDIFNFEFYLHLTRKIQNLIRFGIDVNAKNQFGLNALHLLCQHNSGRHLIEAIKVLIDFGIDKDAKTEKGWNALHLFSPHLFEAIQELIKLGIDKDA
ncbi:calcium-dependent protein kinase 3 [Daphnia magna]|uniref:calcium-dependent protein kinase 3 n=1 Tax=Daphnia magna TaxID=35525 RepID=UPI001E1BDE10|nr:calcium-dependent protein kinase 3 [Daphnia magna]